MYADVLHRGRIGAKSTGIKIKLSIDIGRIA
jgi:hypothetical protein